MPNSSLWDLWPAYEKSRRMLYPNSLMYRYYPLNHPLDRVDNSLFLRVVVEFILHQGKN